MCTCTVGLYFGCTVCLYTVTACLDICPVCVLCACTSVLCACTSVLYACTSVLCTYNLSRVAVHLSRVCTGVGDSGRFKDKTDFPTMTRMAYCQCRLRKVFGSVFQQFNWTDITLIMDRDDDHSLILGETLDVGLQRGGYLPQVQKYYGLSHPDFADILIEASRYSRSK